MWFNVGVQRLLDDQEGGRPRFPRTTQAERTRWTERFRRSGQTQREFAAAHGFSVSSLNLWLRQQSQRPLTPRFQEISLPLVAAALPGWDAEVILGPGRVVRLRGALARELLAPWLNSRV